MKDQQAKIGSAALMFAMDGYTTQNGLNGRRIAGESFLKGYVKHSRSETLNALSVGIVGGNAFRRLATDMGNKRPIHTGTFEDLHLPNGQTNLYAPSPNFQKEAWRRLRLGERAYSISGVTHTIASEGVTAAMFDMRTAPVQSWDAVICTSQAVVDSLTYQLDEVDDFLKHRFGKVPERFQMPLIPLGINVEDFQITPQGRAAWRSDLGIGEDDIVVITVARLSSFAKMDPLPLFMALQLAAVDCPHKVHLIGLGPFSDGPARKMYTKGIKEFAPDVTFHHVDGEADPAKRDVIAAADIFTLPVDNIQESFGLSPVEAMAAGLPVVVSDWNGFKDTIAPDCGFRIPTLGPTPGTMSDEAWKFFDKKRTYIKHIAIASQMTSIDIPAMGRAFGALFNNPDLRKRMGAAGAKRARDVFDWKNIVPQYEDLWTELDARRTQHKETSHFTSADPLPLPDPTRMFENYPTSTFERAHLFRAVGLEQNVEIETVAQKVDELIEIRGLKVLECKTAPRAAYINVLYQICAQDQISFDALAKSETVTSEDKLERCLLWLMKYNLITQFIP